MLNPISDFLIKRKIKKSGMKFSRSDVLKAVPVRNTLVKWDQDDGGEVSLVVPQKSTLFVRVVSRAFMLPKSRVIVLDEVGSLVWVMCDGNNSMENIIKALCNKYKLTRKEAESSLFAYFRMLSKRGIIGFAIPRGLKQEETKQELESNL